MKRALGLLLMASVGAAVFFAACQQPVSPPAAVKSSDATLSALTVSYGGTQGNLSPAFAADVTAYAVNIPTTIDQVIIAAASTSSAASVSGTGTLPLGAAGTTTTASIAVTAEDGSKKTYTIAVNRASVAASTDASLQSLSILVGGTKQTLSPTFTTGTHDYTVTVPNYAGSVTVEAKTTDSKAVAGGTGGKNLTIGPNTITVTGIAEDGTTTATYTVIATRDIPDSDYLGSLSTSAGVLAPTLVKTTPNYTITLPYGTSGTTISAGREYTGPTLEYSMDSTNYNQMTSGSFSVSGVGAGNSTIVNIRSSSRAGSNRTYNITVRQASSGASSDANLSALVIQTYYGNVNIPLSPSFSSSVDQYTASVSNSVNRIFVIPAKSDSNAICSPVSYTAYTLAVGSNAIPVVVTAADGVTQKTYMITVTRNGQCTATITSPAVNTTVSPGSIIIEGSYTDSAGVAASAKIAWGTQTVYATLNTTAKTFTGTLDLALAPNGPLTVSATILDGLNQSIANALVNVVVSGSSVPAYSISGTAYTVGSVIGSQYLYLSVMPNTGSSTPGTTGQILIIPVTAESFPVAYTVSGITAGDYQVGACLLSAPVFSIENLVASSFYPANVSISNANQTGADVLIAPNS